MAHYHVPALGSWAGRLEKGVEIQKKGKEKGWGVRREKQADILEWLVIIQTQNSSCPQQGQRERVTTRVSDRDMHAPFLRPPKSNAQKTVTVSYPDDAPLALFLHYAYRV